MLKKKVRHLGAIFYKPSLQKLMSDCTFFKVQLQEVHAYKGEWEWNIVSK